MLLSPGVPSKQSSWLLYAGHVGMGNTLIQLYFNAKLRKFPSWINMWTKMQLAFEMCTSPNFAMQFSDQKKCTKMSMYTQKHRRKYYPPESLCLWKLLAKMHRLGKIVYKMHSALGKMLPKMHMDLWCWLFFLQNGMNQTFLGGNEKLR